MDPTDHCKEEGGSVTVPRADDVVPMDHDRTSIEGIRQIPSDCIEHRADSVEDNIVSSESTVGNVKMVDEDTMKTDYMPAVSTSHSLAHSSLSSSSLANDGSADGANESVPSPKPKIRIHLRHRPKKDPLPEDSSMKVTSNNLEHSIHSQTEETGKTWICTKCIHSNAQESIRCWNCKGWRDDTRENFPLDMKCEDEEDVSAAESDDRVDSDGMDIDVADRIEDDGSADAPISSTLQTTEPNNDVPASEEEDEDDLPIMSLKTKPSKKENSTSAELSTLGFTKSSNSSSFSAPSSSEPIAPKITSAPPTNPNGPKRSKSSSSFSQPKTKLFSGTLRSAAAAHRNRQIQVPPIGSPGLLMIPSPSLMSHFATEDDGKNEPGESGKKLKSDDISKWLYNGYLLPRMVFEQAMIAGGYTFDVRKTNPHRGSSTQRTVGDVFDSDASLYLHFPELIPLELWEKRIGDRIGARGGGDDRTNTRQVGGGENQIIGDGDLAQIEGNGDVSECQGQSRPNEDENTSKLIEKSEGPPITESMQCMKDDPSRVRLVDVLVSSLCKLTGETLSGDVPAVTITPDTASSTSFSGQDTNPNKFTVANEDLPKFIPAIPQIRKRCRPHQPLSFLDMIPISLTCCYPKNYVEKRRAYAQAVKERELAIVESQEAADDAVDNKEKYQAHKEAWDRMFEYQKQQIAKREAAAEEAKRKAEEEGIRNSEASGSDGGVGGSGVDAPVEERKDDPLDFMPPPPNPPPPERIVTVPDIPTPPSPPLVVEVDDDVQTDDLTLDGLDANTMYIPKLDSSLLQHLDPDFFLPTMEGRYFGLLSNSISDPQFVGPCASGIRGVTSGGGTGLATSYVGGGRGAAGLVSGPLRGGNTWQQQEQPATVTAAPSDVPKPVVKKESESTVSVPDVPTVPTDGSAKKAASSSSKKTKRDGEKSGSETESTKKKVKRIVPLATGDRNTTATEIASGPAGPDFPEGWTVKTYRRAGGETVGKTDRFWFSPGLNIRFRAKKHAMSFIDILADPNVNGDEDVAADAYRLRGLHF